ncbi:MAG: zinc ribbon domain-containing protein [Eubacterium sp.]|nr:zinc ribbon domain-containing protein [Eubacterium sp.]
MKYCPKCGNSMGDDFKFCPKCGATSHFSGTGNQAGGPVGPGSESTAPNKGKGKIAAIISVIAAVVAIVCVTLIIVLKSSDGSGSDSQEQLAANTNGAQSQAAPQGSSETGDAEVTPEATETAAPTETPEPTPTPEPKKPARKVIPGLLNYDKDSIVGKQTKLEKGYAKCAYYFETNRLSRSNNSHNYGKNEGVGEFRGGGMPELFFNGYVYSIKGKRPRIIHSLPASKGNWWSYNKKRKIFFNYNTSGWDGGYVWKVKGKRNRLLYGFRCEHNENRDCYLIKGGRKRKISAKTFEKYEKKVNHNFEGKNWVELGVFGSTRTQIISNLHTLAGDHPVVYDIYTDCVKSISFPKNVLKIQARGKHKFEKFRYKSSKNKWVTESTDYHSISLPLAKNCLFTVNSVGSRGGKRIYVMGSVKGRVSLKRYRWKYHLKGARMAIGIAGLSVYVRNNKVVRVNLMFS